jgi:DNA (cytosine-5)-methyltransferase 1
MQKDKRNYLLNYVVSIIKELNPKYILIENVPRFLNMYFKHSKQFLQPTEFLVKELGDKYEIVENVFNTNDFNVPQDRKRALIRLYKKGLTWKDPVSSKAQPTLRDAIGHLPSIESGEHSNIPWHYGRVHSESHINAMQLTPEGKSAFEFNNILKSENGKVPKGFKTTYARMEWDKPCPTITMRNDAISSQRNVHPGRRLKNGKYSDARVLSIKELFLLTGLANSFTLPKDIPEILIRQVIGEAVPPKLIHAVCKGIFQ